MKRTEDYYRGLLLLKQDWNADKNEQAISIIKVKLNMIDRLQEKTLYDGQPNITAICNNLCRPLLGGFYFAKSSWFSEKSS